MKITANGMRIMNNASRTKKRIGVALIGIAILLFLYLIVTFVKDPPPSYYFGGVLCMLCALVGTILTAE